MNVLQQAVAYASDEQFHGAGFSLHVTTTQGSMYVNALTDDAGMMFVRTDEGFAGIEVFINPAHVVTVEVIW